MTSNLLRKKNSRMFLSKIARGETVLASLELSVVKDGEYYVLNGPKSMPPEEASVPVLKKFSSKLERKLITAFRFNLLYGICAYANSCYLGQFPTRNRI